MVHTPDTQSEKKYPVGIPLIILLSVGFGWWVLTAAHTVQQQYDAIDLQNTNNQQPLFKTITFDQGTSPIVMPINDPFRDTGRWIYANNAHPLPVNYTPAKLTAITVAHVKTTGSPTLQPEASTALSGLFAAATEARTPLIAVSAYRSIAEQQELYSFRVALLGKEVADETVAQPGASEHHTGLAVDVNDYTVACETNPQQCGLSPNTARWLATHAPEYGFIIRYPDGKLAQTGIGYEPWHLRYVGKDAVSLTLSGLTLDEFYERVTAR